MNNHDISKYTLEELYEAFESVNDIKYPNRAVDLYLKIIELEKSDQENEKPKHMFFDKLPKFLKNYLHSVANHICRRSLLYLFLSNKYQNKNYEIIAKIDRVQKLITQ